MLVSVILFYCLVPETHIPPPTDTAGTDSKLNRESHHFMAPCFHFLPYTSCSLLFVWHSVVAVASDVFPKHWDLLLSCQC